MLPVNRVELILIRLPRVSRFQTAYGDHAIRETVLARVVMDGVEGWGEFAGDGPGFSYETPLTAWHILRDYLIPILLAAQIESPSMCPALFAGVRGHPFAKAMIEAALWDIAGKQTGQSLHALLQRLMPEQTLRDCTQVGVSVGLQTSVAVLQERLEGLQQLHLSRIKLKVRPGWDAAAIQTTRNMFPGVPVMLDGNAAYARSEADRLARFDSLGLQMIEQPFAPDDLLAHRALQGNMLKTPICLDESIHSVRVAESAIRWSACRAINIKPGRVGGLTQAIELHNLCADRKVPVYCGGMFETGIGKSLNAALACLPNFLFPSDSVPAERLYSFDLIRNPLRYAESGDLLAPTSPGLGFEVDMDRVRSITHTSLMLP